MKAFQNKEEWCFPFSNIVFRFRDIYVFLSSKWGKWWLHRLFPKKVKHWIKSFSRNIRAVLFKLGIRNVHHTRHTMAYIIMLPWLLSWIQALSAINQISPFATLQSLTEGPVWDTHCAYINYLNPSHCFLGVESLWLSKNWGMSVLWQNRCHGNGTTDGTVCLVYWTLIYGTKFEEHHSSWETLNSLFYLFVERLMMSSLSSFA